MVKIAHIADYLPIISCLTGYVLYIATSKDGYGIKLACFGYTVFMALLISHFLERAKLSLYTDIAVYFLAMFICYTPFKILNSNWLKTFVIERLKHLINSLPHDNKKN